ncbi:hypothetical protein Xmau_00109 [Xenorhabdus mauleonii]|uniref:Uncharacterized protein n=1 Tax=Xenorhabdus mauleonii TaxID=351675 RepID=A0A1I3NCQ7_9GAMM|nr:hypothetical protein [Xenorhabdus mauleonii]PHM45723.1 hypothetical protein Xmau_00109 [Xenorhabdus mauleonii]SFJ06606.1 hypothetical protein SAMN05421680_105150 [Xenorhabdus mauleonii]
MEQNDRTQVISTKEWVWTIILVMIPVVNLVFLAYWSLSKSTNLNKKNYAIANWIVTVFGLLLYAILIISTLSNSGSYS